MGGLYKLSVGITLKDQTKSGFAQIEKQAADAQKRTESLQKSLKGIQDATGHYDSRSTAQEKIVQLARQEVELRKQLVNTTDADEKTRIEGELKALGLMKQELSVRKQELGIQDNLLKSAFKEQRNNATQAQRDANTLAAIKERNEREMAAQAYRDQQEQERRDLASIRMVAEAQKRADAENAHFREERRNQRSEAVESHLNSILGARSAAYEAQQARRSEIGSSLSMGAGIAAGEGASFILGGLKQGVKSGSDMQMSMMTTQIATAASDAQMSGLRDLAFSIADQTAQSASDAMKNISILAGSGLNDPTQLRQLAAPIAKFADVQFLKNHTSFEESAKQGVQIAHLFGAYTPEKINPILEKLTQVSFAMPDNLKAFLTQAGYYEPIFKGAGVKDADAIEAGAIIDRIGMGKGKGGSALGNLVLNQMNALAQTGHVQKGRMKGLRLLGLANEDGTSKFYGWNAKDKRNEFDIVGALKQIDKSVRGIPEGLTGKQATAWQLKRLGALNAALGLTGERVGLAITPEAISGLDDSLKRIAQSGTMSQIQGKYMGTLGAQQSRFKSNMDSLLTDLMWPWLDELRKGFSWMGDEAHTVQAWAHTHKDAAKQVSFSLGLVGAALAVYSGAQLMGIASGLRAVSAAIKTIAAAEAAGGFGAAAGGVGAASGAVVGGGEAFAASRAPGLMSAAALLPALAIGGGVGLLEGVIGKINPSANFDNRPGAGLQAELEGLPQAIALALANVLNDHLPGGVTIQGDVHNHGSDGIAHAKQFTKHIDTTRRASRVPGPLGSVWAFR